MMRYLTTLKVLLPLVCLVLFSSRAFSEEETFYCEVLSVEGTAYLTNAEVYGKTVKEGDLLKAADELETGTGSTVDLSFDKEWSNVTRVEENTRIKVKAVFPTRLFMDKGALYAKLKSLPKDSTFQVETPTAIAAVRGTEYRTEYANGETLISNDSEKETSKVYIYEADDAGELKGEPTVLPRTQFSGVPRNGRASAPKPMTQMQQQRCQSARGTIDKRIQENQARGRVAKIQDVRKMEAFGQKIKERQNEQREKFQRRRDDQHLNNPNDPHSGSGNGDRGGRGGDRIGRGEGQGQGQGRMERDRSENGEGGPGLNMNELAGRHRPEGDGPEGAGKEMKNGFSPEEGPGGARGGMRPGENGPGGMMRPGGQSAMDRPGNFNPNAGGFRQNNPGENAAGRANGQQQPNRPRQGQGGGGRPAPQKGR